MFNLTLHLRVIPIIEFLIIKSQNHVPYIHHENMGNKIHVEHILFHPHQPTKYNEKCIISFPVKQVFML